MQQMKNFVKNYQIFTTPSTVLKQPSKIVSFPLSEQTKDSISYLKVCFKKSLNSSPTVGLSAPQVGINQRFFIVPSKLNYLQHTNSLSTMKSLIKSFDVYINPIVLCSKGEEKEEGENCKSVEGQYLVKRQQTVEVEYQNMNGETIKKQLSGFMGRLFQHEVDHLLGITIDQIGKKVGRNSQQEGEQSRERKVE